MKIISRYKDYYDFVGKQYGEDEKLVYNRLDFFDYENHRNTDDLKVELQGVQDKIPDNINFATKSMLIRDAIQLSHKDEIVTDYISISFLCFCGVPYLIANYKWKNINDKQFDLPKSNRVLVTKKLINPIKKIHSITMICMILLKQKSTHW